MSSNYETVQAEEVEVLAAIYGTEWAKEGPKTYSLKIEVKTLEVTLHVTMAPGYPEVSPPHFELSAPWMDRKVKAKLFANLKDYSWEHLGNTVIYQCAEKIREALYAMSSASKSKRNVKRAAEVQSFSVRDATACPEIVHGPVISDRKSNFQGHAAQVHSVQDVQAVLQKLKQNKKILNAKHNMYAFIIEKHTEKGIELIQDCDDDGESHAGSRMLHLLQVLGQRNAVVVVTRWYGGIHLGPDRFRHINNASRQALQHAGLLRIGT